MSRIKSADFSRPQLAVFIIAFALIGYLIFKSFALNPNLPGDANDDNIVDISDLSILLSTYGSTTDLRADFDNSKAIDIPDLSILLRHFGESITQSKPSIPTGLTATPGDGSVKLSWNANSTTEGVDTYQVYWGTDSTLANFTFVDNIQTTSYTVPALTNGTTYYFRISAHNSSSYGPWGPIVSAVPQSAGGGGGTSGVIPPTPPSAYTLPSGTLVSTTAGLISALSGSTRDIILANGIYTNAASLQIGNHRLWAQNLGGATLQFGLQFGGNGSVSGGEIHGLKLDISNASATFDNAAISIWGSTAGQNAGIFDSWIYGHMALTFGIEDRITNGFKAQRLIMNGFTDYGVFIQTYSPNYYTDTPTTIPVVTDIDVSAVYNSPRGATDGKGEAGVWVGTNATVSRIKVRDTGWMGIWTGDNANYGTYSDLDIDNIHGTVPSSGSVASIGIYLEHYSRNNVFKNFVIGNSSLSGIMTGFNCEWANPNYAGTNPVAGQSVAACHYNTFQDGTIYSSYLGISLEDAEKTTIQRIKFIGQSRAAIKDFMTSGTGYTTIWQNLGNDFSGLAPGAVLYTQAH